MQNVVRTGRRVGLLFTVSLLFLTGCLPYSCQQERNKTVFPSDSLSRRVAADTPADTLEPVGTVTGSAEQSLAYPRTVRFVEDGAMVVSDAKRNQLLRFGPDGAFQRAVVDSAFAVPYLMGRRGDTLVVFNAGANRIDFVTEGRRLADHAISYERPSRQALVYMLATDTALYAKTVEEDAGASVERLDDTGTVTARAPLDGPHWRHAGFLRDWGDSLVSLSGYRPVVHRLAPDFAAGATGDSLSLIGFDSPMLARSYSYVTGEIDKPPLLTTSAAAAGDTLFVLNLRPGWVQIDAYDRQGRLQERLVERHSGGNRDFYPVDLDARRTDDGYRFVVAVRSPTPQLALFSWTPSRNETQTAAR